MIRIEKIGETFPALGLGSGRYLSCMFRVPCCCESAAVENFINKPLGPNVFHVHLQG